MSYMVYEIVEGDNVDGRIIKVHCEKCSQGTCHRILASTKQRWDEIEDNDIYFSGFDRYQIIHCEGCETISFRHLSYWSENDEPEEKLYPESFIENHELKNFPVFEKELSEIYYEAVSSFNAGNFILCAVGIRAIIEGICKDKGVKKGYIRNLETDEFVLYKNGSRKTANDLRGKILGLRDKEIITKSQNKILHQLRFLGNDAIHKLYRPSQEELKTALLIIENMIENLYVIPLHAEKLISRK